MARKLSVVTEDSAPTRPKGPTTIKAAVDRTERDLLVAMRAKVAAEIDAGVPAHALAPLMRQLRDLDKEIRALDARDAEEQGHVEDGGGEATDAPFNAEAL